MEAKTNVWYTPRKGMRGMALAYCPTGEGERWIVLTQSGNHISRRMNKERLLPFLEETRFVRGVHTHRQVFDCLKSGSVESLPKQETRYVLLYQISSHETPLYYREQKGGPPILVAEPRLASTYTKEEALSFIERNLHVTAELGDLRVSYSMFRLAVP